MDTSKVFSRLFAVLGCLLAAAVLVICVLARDAAPSMMSAPAGASQCADNLFGRLSSGDYAGASAYLYGNPKLDAGEQLDSEISQQIWDTFTDSLEYELMGSCYATATGVAQDVFVRSLNIASITGGLQQRAGTLLEQRVAGAENMRDVYDDNLQYREDFIDSVLRDATAQAVARDGVYMEQRLTLNLVYDQGRWYVVPDKALLGAISGGILG